MVRNYETVFILTPVLSEDQRKSSVKKYISFLKKNSATIINEEDWGLKQLAYPIQGKGSGFYLLIEFEADGTIVDKLETEYARDEAVIRHLVVKLDKHGVAYNKKRQNGELASQKKSSSKTEKETAKA